MNDVTGASIHSKATKPQDKGVQTEPIHGRFSGLRLEEGERVFSVVANRMTKAGRSILNWTFRSKLLLAVWLLFFLLVALGVHGSSTPSVARWWAPEMSYGGYLIDKVKPGTSQKAEQVPWLSQLLMAQPREIRSDEWLVWTPWALSQLSHSPRFPVVNRNIGTGQNMLVFSTTPVWHIATLARPATWGYFILGARRGFAWLWWFQVFACFTVLFLLMEVILDGDQKLAAFGAFWFCASAYVVGWSLWPAYVVFFPALACLSGYHLLRSVSRRVQILCGVLLGVSLAGFAMVLYPAWQVPLAYLFILIFVGLALRDRLFAGLRPFPRYRVLCLTIGVVICCGLVLAFVWSCRDDFRIMSATIYPGQRVSLGGDYPLWKLFRGNYNLGSMYEYHPGLMNQSEEGAFYLLFPAVLPALLLSGNLRRSIGIVAWLLASLILVLLFFLYFGVPESVAKLTLLRYLAPKRVDLSVGLASIILVVRLHAIAKLNQLFERKRRLMLLCGLFMAAIIAATGVNMTIQTNGFPSSHAIVLATLVGGVLSYWMLSGNTGAFTGLTTILVIATVALFNPLTTSLSHIYNSEVARQIKELDAKHNTPPLWVCYGNTYLGSLVTILGGRSISGNHWPPQMSFWHALDPAGEYETSYNGYCRVFLAYENEPMKVAFSGENHRNVLWVGLNPRNPVLSTLGAKYVLADRESQSKVDASQFPLIYKSANGAFSIFEIPQSGDLDNASTPLKLSATQWIQGAIETADCDTVVGYVWDRSHPKESLSVDILDGNTVIGTVSADIYRNNLFTEGIHRGPYGFSFQLPPSVRDGNLHRIGVRVSVSNVPLRDSPKPVACR